MTKPINPKTLKIGQQFIIKKGIAKEGVAVFGGTFENKYGFQTAISGEFCGEMELTAKQLKQNPFDLQPIDSSHPHFIPNCDNENNNGYIKLLKLFSGMDEQKKSLGRELTDEEVASSFMKALNFL